jgi:hypothetical protein
MIDKNEFGNMNQIELINYIKIFLEDNELNSNISVLPNK